MTLRYGLELWSTRFPEPSPTKSKSDVLAGIAAPLVGIELWDGSIQGDSKVEAQGKIRRGTLHARGR